MHLTILTSVCSGMESPWTAPNPMETLWTALRAPGLRPCPQAPHRAPLAHRPFGSAHSLPTPSAFGWKPLRGSHSRRLSFGDDNEFFEKKGKQPWDEKTDVPSALLHVFRELERSNRYSGSVVPSHSNLESGTPSAWASRLMASMDTFRFAHSTELT